MNREEAINDLIRTTILLIRIRGLIKDKFFLHKFTSKIFALASTFVISISEDRDGILRRELLQRTITAIDGMLENINDLLHLNLLRTSPLSLRACKYLLLMKINTLSEMRKLREVSRPVVQVKPAESRQEVYKNIGTAVNNKKGKLNPSKQKILDFIKSYPNTRTKDIIQEFNALSDRTVKRNLTELLHTGVIQKKVDSKAVYYYPSE